MERNVRVVSIIASVTAIMDYPKRSQDEKQSQELVSLALSRNENRDILFMAFDIEDGVV